MTLVKVGEMLLLPGSRIRHAELGEGVVLEAPADGWLREIRRFSCCSRQARVWPF